ncbi:class I SAM-dependent methyltransferase [bacterium]|nr:class I SAM-dependent methyltransferase [bacterium]
MTEDYDGTYAQDDYFGAEPSELLARFDEFIPENARVLDIGAGQGRNTLPLARRGCRVTALDPSAVAIETIAKAARKAKLDIDLVPKGFMAYEPPRVFDVILCFGLMQILNYHECASLVTRLHQWLRSGGTLFLTAWHVEDPSFPRLVQEWERLGIRSFRSPEGDRYRLFLEKGEIPRLFFRWQPVHLWEGLGPVHRHGDGPEERHGVVEAVLTHP